ncbi:hypothetical protein SAMN04487948_12275 [Halogranum amylolyticum]|uniref:Uncharacterized protein n=1 Tax=Halogranum amylolyticum TaxID=660520 RepID=A0A1H8W4J3_9EURY|nr:hypothetical protein [Halogranum amylolyticum]SEP22078.1 hypothetical protein SAMN04487948_12275 [Halogranum amylolyticum]
MTTIDGHTAGEAAKTTYTVTLQSYLVDFVTDRLAVEVLVDPPGRPVDTLWVVDGDVVRPLWRPSRRYSDEQLSAALVGAGEFVRRSTNLQYLVGPLPPECLSVETRVEFPTVD